MTVLEKGMEEPVTCHFMIDWMNAQVGIIDVSALGMLPLTSWHPYHIFCYKLGFKLNPFLGIWVRVLK